jgi:hypothetical protein
MNPTYAADLSEVAASYGVSCRSKLTIFTCMIVMIAGGCAGPPDHGPHTLYEINADSQTNSVVKSLGTKSNATEVLQAVVRETLPGFEGGRTIRHRGFLGGGVTPPNPEPSWSPISRTSVTPAEIRMPWCEQHAKTQKRWLNAGDVMPDPDEITLEGENISLTFHRGSLRRVPTSGYYTFWKGCVEEHVATVSFSDVGAIYYVKLNGVRTSRTSGWCDGYVVYLVHRRAGVRPFEEYDSNDILLHFNHCWDADPQYKPWSDDSQPEGYRLATVLGALQLLCDQSFGNQNGGNESM